MSEVKIKISIIMESKKVNLSLKHFHFYVCINTFPKYM